MPTQVTKLDNLNTIAAGSYHSLALLSDGTLWAWGANYDGQCGNNPSYYSSVTEPITVKMISNDIAAISCGLEHSLALLLDGTVWTWGGNSHGQLGIGTITPFKYVPTQVIIKGKVTTIAGGRYHSLALLSDVTLQAWGDNLYCELGNNTQTQSSLPESVHKLSKVIIIAQSYGEHNLAIESGPVRGIEWLETEKASQLWGRFYV